MLLKPKENVWCVAQARRAAMLIDGADYFAALRRAMIKARRSIMIAGWDIDSRTELVGASGEPEDDFPARLADFLAALVAKTPGLDISLLLWDFSVLYAAERDPFPTVHWQWNTPSQIRFCLDDCVPLGSSQHQKLVVIDDAVAFSGGLDVTIRRWDTHEHRIDEPRRVDPSDHPYKPFHDVQMIVDGEVARALGRLVRERWACAACESLPETPGDSDPWPDHVKPDFTGLDIGIARTQPRYENQPEVHEVERLFLDCIDAAEHAIYIENQFLTAASIAERLAQRLKDNPRLEVLIVAPQSHDSWLEAHSMRIGRIAFMKLLRAAARDRVHLVYPQVADGERSVGVMVHSKVLVVDDKILRVGSANLNNRSMGTDTECDLVVVGKSEDERRRIATLRNRLIGDHCGVPAHEVAKAIDAAGGSLIAAVRTLQCNGRSLQPISDEHEEADELVAVIQDVADPEKPIGAEQFVSNMVGGLVPPHRVSRVVKVIAVGLVLIALALAWQYVPLAKPEAVRSAFASIAHEPYAPLIVIGAFVAGSFVMFPVMILIAATAAAFGPWLGFGYATVGALASSIATFLLGRAVGKKPLRNLLGPRLNRVRQRVAKRGVIAVAAIRLVPIGPFSVINMVAGASGIPVYDFLAGTLLGMLPGLIMISAIGHQLAHVMMAPTLADVALLVVAVAGWIAISIGVQALVSRYWSGKR
jgi:phospholipase D1/2